MANIIRPKNSINKIIRNFYQRTTSLEVFLDENFSTKIQKGSNTSAPTLTPDTVKNVNIANRIIHERTSGPIHNGFAGIDIIYKNIIFDTSNNSNVFNDEVVYPFDYSSFISSPLSLCEEYILRNLSILDIVNTTDSTDFIKLIDNMILDIKTKKYQRDKYFNKCLTQAKQLSKDYIEVVK